MSEPDFPCDTEDYAAAQRAQATAADPLQSAWVAANAGSGKTKVLIDRVARLLLRDAPPDSILCITYTRAAANEMISRLFKRLGDWSVMESGELARRLGRLEDRQPSDYDEAAIKKARALFAKALETPGGLRIETIHAFSARLLRRFPLEAEILPGFQEIEDADAEALWQTAAREAVLDLASAEPDILDRVALEGGGLGIDAALGL
ncbi:MAG: UvrD-helicase domain-containing protein, partial [Pseudomonadota bacterium]